MDQHRSNEFVLLPKAQKVRLLTILMALDDEQRSNRDAYRANGSYESRRAYIASRHCLQEAEALYRQARAGHKGALQRLMAFGRPVSQAIDK